MANDQLVICKNITRGVVEFPEHFKDKELQSVILQLLVKDVTRRLGCTRGGAAEAKAHPFFRSIDWERLRRRELAAPWKPLLADGMDVSHFDEYDERDEVKPYEPGEAAAAWDAEF